MNILLTEPRIVIPLVADRSPRISFSAALAENQTLGTSSGDVISPVAVSLTCGSEDSDSPSLDFFFGDDSAAPNREVYFDIVIPLNPELFNRLMTMVPIGLSGWLRVDLSRTARAVTAYASDEDELLTAYVWDQARIESLDITGSELTLHTVQRQ